MIVKTLAIAKSILTLYILSQHTNPCCLWLERTRINIKEICISGNDQASAQNFVSYENLRDDFNCNINGVLQGEWYSR